MGGRQCVVAEACKVFQILLWDNKAVYTPGVLVYKHTHLQVVVGAALHAPERGEDVLLPTRACGQVAYLQKKLRNECMR